MGGEAGTGMAETLRQRWQRRIQAVLGAAVLAGGLGFGVATVGGTLVEAAAMSGWRPVEARLRQVRLVRHRDDGAVRFETRARYTYEVGGVTYRGRRIGLHDGPDDIGDYQRRLHAQLKRLKGNGQPVTVWVDPADPSRAVIDPKPRWELLGVRSAFSVIFAAMGAVLLLHARRRPSPAPDPAAAEVAGGVEPGPDVAGGTDQGSGAAVGEGSEGGGAEASSAASFQRAGAEAISPTDLVTIS